jgi:hypothetical protein
LVLAFVGAAMFIGAHSQDLKGTLKNIKDSGEIMLGVRDYTVPFSYRDDKQSYQGYLVDLCMRVVNAVQRELGMSFVNVTMNPVTASTRIPCQDHPLTYGGTLAEALAALPRSLLQRAGEAGNFCLRCPIASRATEVSRLGKTQVEKGAIRGKMLSCVTGPHLCATDRGSETVGLVLN